MKVYIYLITATLFLMGCKDETPSSKKTQPISTAIVMLDNEGIYATGHKILLSQKIELKKGREIDFYLIDGSTVNLTGPITGELQNLIKIDSSATKWSIAAIDLLSKQNNESHALTIRSGDNTSKNWLAHAIPVPFKGTFCINEKIAPILFRPGISSNDLHFQITNGDKATKLKIPAGENSVIKWPSNFPHTGEFSLKNKGWFNTPKFIVKVVDFNNIQGVLEAGCSYHLTKIKNLVHTTPK